MGNGELTDFELHPRDEVRELLAMDPLMSFSSGMSSRWFKLPRKLLDLSVR